MDKEAGVVTVTSKDLGDVQTLFEICERWGLTAVLDKQVVFSEGPWAGKNMIIAREQYYEVNGYSLMAKCKHNECISCLPNVVTKMAEDLELEWRAVREQFPQNSGDNSPFRSCGNAVKLKSSVPEATREQERRELLSFCQQCWKSQISEEREIWCTWNMDFT